MNSDSDKNYGDNETSMKGVGEDKREEINHVCLHELEQPGRSLQGSGT